jgi:hypothetical protein
MKQQAKKMEAVGVVRNFLENFAVNLFNRSNGWDPRISSVCSYIYWVELKEYLPESYR